MQVPGVALAKEIGKAKIIAAMMKTMERVKRPATKLFFQTTSI
jgi:hypothetical protein